jgi:hypothetical protein
MSRRLSEADDLPTHTRCAHRSLARKSQIVPRLLGRFLMVASCNSMDGYSRLMNSRSHQFTNASRSRCDYSRPSARIAFPSSAPPLSSPRRHGAMRRALRRTPNRRGVCRGLGPGGRPSHRGLAAGDGASPGADGHTGGRGHRLIAVFSTRAARLGTLHELTKLGPVPIVADALGYHPSTIERHAIGSASVYAEYVAARRDVG